MNGNWPKMGWPHRAQYDSIQLYDINQWYAQYKTLYCCCAVALRFEQCSALGPGIKLNFLFYKAYLISKHRIIKCIDLGYVQLQSAYISISEWAREPIFIMWILMCSISTCMLNPKKHLNIWTQHNTDFNIEIPFPKTCQRLRSSFY